MLLSRQVRRAPFMPAANIHHVKPQHVMCVGCAPFIPATNIHPSESGNNVCLRHEMRAEPSVGQADDSTCYVKINKLHNSNRPESENHFEHTKTEQGDIYPRANRTNKRYKADAKSVLHLHKPDCTACPVKGHIPLAMIQNYQNWRKQDSMRSLRQSCSCRQSGLQKLSARKISKRATDSLLHVCVSAGWLRYMTASNTRAIVKSGLEFSKLLHMICVSEGLTGQLR